MNENVNLELEEIARKHLGIPNINDKNFDNVNLSSLSIKIALQEAFKRGEESGYNAGFNNAKIACDCNHL